MPASRQEQEVPGADAQTVHGLPLLRPGPDADERIVGALGRAAEYYGIDVYAFAFASSHYHLLYGAQHGLAMSSFQCHLNSNIAREIGRLHAWREKFWSRRIDRLEIQIIEQFDELSDRAVDFLSQ